MDVVGGVVAPKPVIRGAVRHDEILGEKTETVVLGGTPRLWISETLSIPSVEFLGVSAVRRMWNRSVLDSVFWTVRTGGRLGALAPGEETKKLK